MLLRKMVELLKDITSTAVLVASAAEGLRVQTMDEAHVGLVDVRLDAGDGDLFEAFECTEPMRVGVSVANFLAVLKFADADDRAIVSVEGPDSDDVRVVLEDPADPKRRACTVTMPVLCVDTMEVELPDGRSPGAQAFDMCSAEFLRLVRDLALFGENVTLETEARESRAVLSTSGKMGTASVRLEKPFEAGEGICKGSFSARFLGTFGKASALCPRVTIELETDKPLVLRYRLTPTGGSCWTFYLAPKLDDDDDDDHDDTAA